MNRNVWVIRAGRGGALADDCREQNLVGIGWDISLDGQEEKDQILAKLNESYPGRKKGRQINAAGQIYRFLRKVNEGDLVLTPITDTREILIGRVTGGYRPRSDLAGDLQHTRKVEWLRTISRDDLSVRARNSAGSILTLFSMNNHGDEIEALLSGEVRSREEFDEGEEEAAEDVLWETVKGQAEELISDRITHMDPFDFEELVAALFRAMGYHAHVTEGGSDRGVDVVAHPDALGLESPRIKVQVKQRKDRAGAPDLRNFSATLRDGDRGVFVSTGGFSRESLYEAGHHSITTLDRDQFVDLFTAHYDKIEPEARAMLPLKKVFIPV